MCLIIPSYSGNFCKGLLRLIEIFGKKQAFIPKKVVKSNLLYKKCGKFHFFMPKRCHTETFLNNQVLESYQKMFSLKLLSSKSEIWMMQTYITNPT